MREQAEWSRIVKAGTLAPSGDNCQPWLFRLGPDFIELHLDPARSDFFIDFDFSATFVSLGAVIENMVLAASALALEARSVLFPEPGNRHHVATIHFTSGSSEHPLARHLGARCTNRRRYRREVLPVREQDVLGAVPPPAGAKLHLVTDPQAMRGIASIVSMVDRTIFEHPRLHGDLFRWVRWTAGRPDGLSVSSLELNALDRAGFRLMSSWPRMRVLNWFGASALAGKKNSHLLTHAAALGLITMEGHGDSDYVEGGRYFERIWLTCSALGLALHPSGSFPFLMLRQRRGGEGLDARQRARFARAGERLEALFPSLAGRTLVMLFRVGRGGAVSERSSRRELTDVVQSQQEEGCR